jgi:phage terminase small subunit
VDLPTTNDPLAFLLSVMGNPAIDLRLRLDAAKTLMPFQHPKAGEGVKDQAKAAAKKAASGRFSSASPPLRVVT